MTDGGDWPFIERQGWKRSGWVVRAQQACTAGADGIWAVAGSVDMHVESQKGAGRAGSGRKEGPAVFRLSRSRVEQRQAH